MLRFDRRTRYSKLAIGSSSQNKHEADSRKDTPSVLRHIHCRIHDRWFKQCASLLRYISLQRENEITNQNTTFSVRPPERLGVQKWSSTPQYVTVSKGHIIKTIAVGYTTCFA